MSGTNSQNPKPGSDERRTARQIGRLWNLTPQAIGLWHSRDGCPRNPDGTYDLARVIEWRERRLREEMQADTKEGAISYLDAVRRETAGRLRIKRLYEEGQYLDRSFVHSLLATLASFLRELGLRLQDAYGVEASNMVKSVVLDPLERTMRQEIAERVKAQADELERENETPRETAKGQRRGRR